ncbi:MAG: Holliday junction resolvase RuvX [Gemmatimonadota bacterium]
MVALDYGRRRIGVAASDPSRTIASPHVTLKNEDPPTEPPQGLLNLLKDLAPAVVLVGIPIHMDGSVGEMASEARKFAARLTALSGLQVLERDERLTSYEADEMLREMDLPRRKRREKGLRDMLAATLLLKEYLEETG